jgi:MoaA/NifB/PqqE/SkfB family radical SAM enzyme
MTKLTKKRVAVLFLRSLQNLFFNKVLSISLEITHSCNCNCTHCDKGGRIPNERLASPQKFGDLVRELKPLVAQISGGDPFLRKDLYEIIEKIKINKHYPYMVLVTNGWLLNEKKYTDLKKLGIDEFSISLDFPDERHDQNRGIPGLFRHLNNIIPQITQRKNQDITLISVIRNQTMAELIKLAEKANEWNTSIVFSAYTPLRTQNFSEAPTQPEQLDYLHFQLNKLMMNRNNYKIITRDSVLNDYYQFFANHCNIPGCRAGYRSLVVNPDGKLAPCAMQPCSFETRKQLIEQFSNNNNCGGCYVSLRANTEKSISKSIKDGFSDYFLSKNGHLVEAKG